MKSLSLPSMTADVVIGAMHANAVSCLLSWSASPVVTIQQSEDIVMMTTGAPSSAMNVAMLRQQPAGDLLEQIAAMAQFFSMRQVPCLWWGFPCRQSEMISASLRAQGFVPCGDAPAMAIDLQAMEDVPPSPDGLDVSPVRDEATMRHWAEVSFAGNEMPDSCKGHYLSFTMPFLHNPSMRLFLGILDGVTVATALTFYSAGMAGIYWVATMPDARRRGVGTTVTRHALMQARREGYSVAALEASEMGQSIYSRIGFHEYGKVSLYERA